MTSGLQVVKSKHIASHSVPAVRVWNASTLDVLGSRRPYTAPPHGMKSSPNQPMRHSHCSDTAYRCLPKATNVFCTTNIRPAVTSLLYQLLEYFKHQMRRYATVTTALCSLNRPKICLAFNHNGPRCHTKGT